jgi:hypothetical protein
VNFFLPSTSCLFFTLYYAAIVSLDLRVQKAQTEDTLHSKRQVLLSTKTYNMAFKLLKYLTLLFVLCGLALANYGAVSSEVLATQIHGRQDDLWVYHDNSSISNSSTTVSPSSINNSPFKGTNRRLLDIDLTNIVLQEPGFVLLSLSFVLISGGMVFL